MEQLGCWPGRILLRLVDGGGGGELGAEYLWSGFNKMCVTLVTQGYASFAAKILGRITKMYNSAY